MIRPVILSRPENTATGFGIFCDGSSVTTSSPGCGAVLAAGGAPRSGRCSGGRPGNGACGGRGAACCWFVGSAAPGGGGNGCDWTAPGRGDPLGASADCPGGDCG